MNVRKTLSEVMKDTIQLFSHFENENLMFSRNKAVNPNSQIFSTLSETANSLADHQLDATRILSGNGGSAIAQKSLLQTANSLAAHQQR